MSEKFSNIKILNKIKNNKKIQYGLIVCLIVIIALIFLISGVFGNKTKQTNSETDYIKSLENKLTETLSKVEGAGKVNVVITVESGMETVLATKTTVTETSNGTETVETPILVNGKTVVLKEKYPKITGVLIVCEGASSITVLHKIQSATVSLFDINVNQVEILKMK